MRKLVVLLATSVALIGTVVGVAVADPGLEPSAAFTPHKHFLVKENGSLVEVGPKVCVDGDQSSNWGAFLQYHANHHTHGGLLNPPGIGGPQGPVAPGLHQGKGPVLESRSCLFNP